MKRAAIGSYVSFFEMILLFLFSGLFVPFANSFSDYGYSGPDAVFLVSVTQNIQLATNFLALAIALITSFLAFLLSLKCTKKDFKLKDNTIICLFFISILTFFDGLAYLIPNACYYNAWGYLFNLIGLLIGIVLLVESLFLAILTMHLARKIKDTETKTVDTIT